MHRIALVRIMAVAASHLPFQYRMMIGQVELSPFIQVALKTNLRRFPGIDNGVMCPSSLVVFAAGAMA
jgi:hypothetical protein